MTRPWNPYALDFQGNRSVGQVPVKVVVYGPELTAVQNAALGSLYARFAMRARLAVVQNLEETGRLPDGSLVRTTVINGVTTITVHTVPAQPRGVTMFGGVVRHVGPVFLDPDYVYREFKENAGPGNNPAVYKDTKKLYGDPDTQAEISASPVWQAFNAKTLSGPAAKLAQFGRGAVKAYHDYFESKSIPLTSRSLGEAVVVLSVGGVKKAWCYGSPYSGGDVWAIPMTIAPLADFPGLKPPQEILDIFGGIPIPPTLVEWEAEIDLLIPSDAIRTLMGAPPGGLLTSEIAFPVYATSGNGSSVYFVASYQDFVLPGDAVRAITYSARFKLTITRSGDSPIGDLVLDSSVGISNFTVPVTYVPVGTHVGQVGVTHVDGGLVTFASTIVVTDSYKLRADAGVITTTTVAKSRIISWGDESVQTMYIDELGSVSGAWSGSTQLVSLGTRSETIVGPPDTTNVFARWQQQSSISANWTYMSNVKDNAGQIYGFGLEGVWLVSRSSQASFKQNAFSGSGAINDAVVEVLISSTVGGVTTTFPNIDPAPYYRDYSATLVWYGDTATEMVGPGMSLTPAQLAVGHGKYPTTANIISPDDQSWVLNLPLGWAGGTTQVNLSEYTPVVYGRDDLHAQGRIISYNALDVFREYETDVYYDSLAAGAAWLLESPIYYIRNEFNVRRGVPAQPHISQLGGFQLVYNMSEHSTKNSVTQSWSLERGTLVSTPYDHAYDAAKNVTFVGELQR